MKTVKEMLTEVSASKSAYITYGDGDLGIAFTKESTLKDIASWEDHQVGAGTWYECDEDGNITE